MGNIFRSNRNPYGQVEVDVERSASSNRDNKAKKWSTTFKAGLRTVKMVLPYFWPKNELELRVRVVICIILLVMGKVINLFVPIMYQRTIDTLPGAMPVGWILLYGGLRWLSTNMRDLRDSVFVKVDNYATRVVALDTFRHLHSLSLGFHLNRNTGAVLRTVDRGKNAISTMLSVLGFTILPTLLELFLTCIVLITTFGAWYSFITFFSISSYIAFTLIVTEWRTKFRRAMNETDNEASNTALDSILNYETVKYFTAEKNELKRYDKSLMAYFDVAVKSQVSLAFLNIGQIAIITIGLVIAMMLIANEVHKGSKTIGDLVAVNAYIIQLYTPLSWLGSSYRMIINAFTDMEKLFVLLEEKPGVVDLPQADELVVKPGGCEIEFRNVTFTYPRRGESSDNPPILRNVSFTVGRGKTVAIVGHSGSGKTTISRMLCRFYDPDSGAIFIDGQNIAYVTQNSLRRAIGVVPQDTVLFNDTLYYNIAYGGISRDDQTMSVEQAAREANIHNFIMSTPDRYQTKVGERGLRLSGGEKQRVAIARTILKDPKILILDEATSALDSRTERDIQGSLMEVSKGRTTVIVAHRLSTVVSADEILVLKKGEIIERGSHRDLIALDGEYKAMWEIQAKESTKTDTASVNNNSDDSALFTLT